ncbi:hypothetical protein TSUD_209740 [Trifolium subterraneum]|uniref:tRNA uridine(34) hydroxylase N-terminal domain-containing protein n=1 Tax=Trifolium subterraneum TaxID=3900 RepID=A0A2Z6NP58_TRISU|nr:hypothetical protein TSUD_209740 [Trifolium subterraneum]
MRWCSEAISFSGAHALAPVALFTNNTLPFQFHNPFFFKFKFNNSSFSSTSLTYRKPFAAQIQPSSSTDSFDFVGLDIHGRIYLNEQGINAQYSGPSKDAMVYVNWIKEDDRFSDILFKSDVSDLPVLDPSMRAIPLAPSEWRDKLEAINRNDQHSKDHPNRDYILLDVRNDYVTWLMLTTSLLKDGFLNAEFIELSL